MVNQVIKLTGSSNHNKCAKADVKDPKAWCYTTDSNKRWEHCNQLCTSPENPDDPDDSVAGTRIRDIPEQVPQVDPRSKYDQKGNCLKNCRSRSLNIFNSGIQQCGRNECQKPKPHSARIHSWFQPQTNYNPGFIDETYEIVSKQYQTPWQVNLIGPTECGGTLIASDVSNF